MRGDMRGDARRTTMSEMLIVGDEWSRDAWTLELGRERPSVSRISG